MFELFRNLENEVLNLEFRLNESSDIAIDVLSSTGQFITTLYRKNIKDEGIILPVADYPPRTYF